MKNLKVQLRVTQILAMLFLLAGVLSSLALNDISHGETDTSAEWAVIQVTVIFGLVFIIFTLSSLGRCLHLLKNSIS